MEKNIMFFYKNYDYVVEFPTVFSDEEINAIHRLASNIEKSEGIINLGQAGSRNYGIDTNVRLSSVSWIVPEDPKNQWIFQRVNEMVHDANNRFFHFDITFQENLQYGRYAAPGGKYGSHMDNSLNPGFNRKLSWSIQLSDSISYEGGDLLIYRNTVENPLKASRKKGSGLVFFSMFLHEVTPVVRGERVSLVGWVSGPPLK